MFSQGSYKTDIDLIRQCHQLRQIYDSRILVVTLTMILNYDNVARQHNDVARQQELQWTLLSLGDHTVRSVATICRGDVGVLSLNAAKTHTHARMHTRTHTHINTHSHTLTLQPLYGYIWVAFIWINKQHAEQGLIFLRTCREMNLLDALHYNGT